jgi:hypothetical protein
VIALHPWLPVAEWQSLGLSVEQIRQPDVAGTALAMPAITPPPVKTLKPLAPAKAGGPLAFLRRLFNR